MSLLVLKISHAVAAAISQSTSAYPLGIGRSDGRQWQQLRNGNIAGKISGSGVIRYLCLAASHHPLYELVSGCLDISAHDERGTSIA